MTLLNRRGIRIFALSFLIFLALIASLTWLAVRNEERQVAHRAQLMASNLATLLESSLNLKFRAIEMGLRSAAQVLDFNAPISQESLKSVAQVLENTRNYSPEINGFYIFDKNNQLIFNAGFLKEQKPGFFSDDFFQSARAGSSEVILSGPPI